MIKLKKEFGKVFYLGYGQKTSEVSSKTAKKAKKPEKYQNFFLVLPKRGTPIKGGLILWFCSTELDLETDPKIVKNISLGDFLLDHFNPNLKYYNGAMYITHECIKKMLNEQGSNNDGDGGVEPQKGGSNESEDKGVSENKDEGVNENKGGPIKIALKGKLIKNMVNNEWKAECKHGKDFTYVSGDHKTFIDHFLSLETNTYNG